jgi:hypothetical protein
MIAFNIYGMIYALLFVYDFTLQWFIQLLIQNFRKNKVEKGVSRHSVAGT